MLEEIQELKAKRDNPSPSDPEIGTLAASILFSHRLHNALLKPDVNAKKFDEAINLLRTTADGWPSAQSWWRWLDARNKLLGSLDQAKGGRK